jgi:hypothetical protein
MRRSTLLITLAFAGCSVDVTPPADPDSYILEEVELSSSSIVPGDSFTCTMDYTGSTALPSVASCVVRSVAAYEWAGCSDSSPTGNVFQCTVETKPGATVGAWRVNHVAALDDLGTQQMMATYAQINAGGNNGKSIDFTVASFSGTIAVDASLAPAECPAPTWTIQPGAYTGSGDWGPTQVSDGDYTITWDDNDIDCLIPQNSPTPGQETLTVAANAQTFDLAPENYTVRAARTASVDVQQNGGDCSGDPGCTSFGGWTAYAAGPFTATDYSDSGTGDASLAATLRDGRFYEVSFVPEPGYADPSPNPDSFVAQATTQTATGNYTATGSCASKTPDSTSTNGWVTSSTQTTAGNSLVLEGYFRPTGHSILAITDNASVSAFNDAHMLVRFSPDGSLVDVYDGSWYGCGTGDGSGTGGTCTFTYTPDEWHKVTVNATIDTATPANSRYTVDVGLCDATPTRIITDAYFRTGAGPIEGGGFDHYALYGGPEPSTLDAQGVTWDATCTARTCAFYDPFSCGAAPDGCGGPALDCDTPAGGTCDVRNFGGWTGQAGDVCRTDDGSYQCCRPLTTAWCAAQGYECGDYSDTCGGTVNCDTGGQTCDQRVPGEICVSGECVDPGGALEPENTQGDTWETIYEACSDESYPAGYRPPLFVRPTTANTGANCTDSTCPNGGTPVTLTDLGTNSITAGGVYENFYLDSNSGSSMLTITASTDVTLRNFELRCNGAIFGINVVGNGGKVTIEYGTIEKGTGYCDYGIIGAQNSGMLIRHVHIDQTGEDPTQFNGNNGNLGGLIAERNLYTRIGVPPVGGAHIDAMQYYNPRSGDTICLLGTRIVPVYEANGGDSNLCYKISNNTQNGPSAPDKWYVYNNWLDGATNNVVAGNGNEQVRNNKFGQMFPGRAWFGTDQGGNVWECDGSAVTDPASPPACTWGFSTWRNANLDGWPPNVTCSANIDSPPVDPTENGWP